MWCTHMGGNAGLAKNQLGRSETQSFQLLPHGVP
jgi:hypothetical protein